MLTLKKRSETTVKCNYTTLRIINIHLDTHFNYFFCGIIVITCSLNVIKTQFFYNSWPWHSFIFQIVNLDILIEIVEMIFGLVPLLLSFYKLPIIFFKLVFLNCHPQAKLFTFFSLQNFR